MKCIELKFCRVEWRNFGCVTIFPNNTYVNAVPHWHDGHYSVIAHRCGYGDDLMGYCREHEFTHAFLNERLFDRPSFVLQQLAQGVNFEPGKIVFEELAAQMFQRWLRANEEPIVSGVDWHAMKQDALRLLA